MRQVLGAAAFAFVAGVTLTPAEAADVLYPPRLPPRSYPEPYPYPAPYYPGYGWVTYVPVAPFGYALPIAPPPVWQVFPDCCADPYYYPGFRP